MNFRDVLSHLLCLLFFSSLAACRQDGGSRTQDAGGLFRVSEQNESKTPERNLDQSAIGFMAYAVKSGAVNLPLDVADQIKRKSANVKIFIQDENGQTYGIDGLSLQALPPKIANSQNCPAIKTCDMPQ